MYSEGRWERWHEDFSFGYSEYGNALNKAKTNGEEQEFLKRINSLFLGTLSELETDLSIRYKYLLGNGVQVINERESWGQGIQWKEG